MSSVTYLLNYLPFLIFSCYVKDYFANGQKIWRNHKLAESDYQLHVCLSNRPRETTELPLARFV